MRYLRIFGLVAMAVIVMNAFFGAGSAAAATELYKSTAPEANDTLEAGTELVASFKAGSSAILKDTNNLTVDTCTGSELKATTENTSGSSVTAPVSSLAFSGCSHKTTVIKPGKLHVEWIPGTPNGTVSSSEAEVTVFSTIFGITCLAKTGAGTTLGTLTGAESASGHATIHLNGVIPMGACGDARLTGTYTITSPTGLVVDEEQKPTTELYKSTAPEANDTLEAGTELVASFKAGSSAILKDTNNLTVDTCTGSELKAPTENTSGSSVTAPVSSLAFSGCSHKTTVIKPGKLHIEWIPGTTNGTVSSSGAEITVFSTIFAISCIAKTESGSVLGTLTGAESASSHATIHLNGVIPMGACGDARLTGTYTVTSPTGLVVDEEAQVTTELYKSTAPKPNDTLGAGTELVASILAGGSSILKDTNGLTVDTCKSSELKAKTENASGATVTAPVSSLSLTGCSHKTTVIKPGKIHIARIAGTTNGTLSSSEAEVTVESTIFGASCIAKTAGGTTLGTLTGATTLSGHATVDINGVIPMGLCGDANLTGSYTVTSPTGLVVDEI